MTKQKKYVSDEKLAEQLADALTTLPDNWIMCRDMRHAWEVDEDFHVTKGQGLNIASVRRTLVCVRCETLRVEKYHSLKWGLEKVAQHYVYPDNYQIHGVPRGVKPSFIIQGEQYRRAMSRIADAAQETPKKTAKKKAAKKVAKAS